MAFSLSAQKRAEKGEKIRNRKTIPAVVYGAKKDSLSLTLAYDQFSKIFRQAGESSLIDLAVDGKEEGKVLVQDIQYDPVSDLVIHVDFKRVDMNKPITAMVKLNFSGEPAIIKEQGGTLVRHIEEVQVRCLPKDLVSHIDVNISNLKTFDDVIRVSDLPKPEGVAIINHVPEDLVAKAIAALTEEEIKAMEEAKPADLSAIEVTGKKPEAEEGAEGEAAEGGDAKAKAPDAAPAKAEEKKK